MIDDPADTKTTSFSLFLSIAVHGVLAVLFILITITYKKPDDTFVDVRFIEYREEKPPPEILEQEAPSLPEQPAQITPAPQPEIPVTPELPAQTEQTSEPERQDHGIEIDQSVVSERESAGNIKDRLPIGTILSEDGMPKKFPALGDHRDTVIVEKGEHVSFDRYIGTLHQKKPISPKGPEDERRRYSDTIFGIKMDGFLSVLPVVRHIGKSFVWIVQDHREKRKIIKAREGRYTDLDEKSIRFLILLWRDGQIDPDRLSQVDRSFIAQHTENNEPIQTNRSYIEGMRQQGLVTSVMKSGRILYRANMTRDEVFQVFKKRLSNAENENEKDELRGYIELINRYYNPIVIRVTVPDDP